jgi:hypothetical protein
MEELLFIMGLAYGRNEEIGTIFGKYKSQADAALEMRGGMDRGLGSIPIATVNSCVMLDCCSKEPRYLSFQRDQSIEMTSFHYYRILLPQRGFRSYYRDYFKGSPPRDFHYHRLPWLFRERLGQPLRGCNYAAEE